MSSTEIDIQIKPKKHKKRKPKKEPRFNVILWNDDEHTFQYVVVMLQQLFGYPPEKGLLLAYEVHRTGRAIVFTSSLGKAELKRDQILAFGADPWAEKNSGPLCATLERNPS
ncbi:ATP-dependent Clp protease ClpS [Planctomycetales bacterium]|nr:ATP-dependent Clp protease ClpS [Planctomycetales bacterium]GHT35072.1 ATP-dependent Clp protease ClpS [Planctomycetales bacterium]